MQLRKDGFIYKVAYRYRGAETKQTNVCRLFWAFTLSLLLVWPFIILIFIPLQCILLLLCFVGGALFGVRPNVLKGDADNLIFVAYTHWPKWHGRNVMPGLLVLAIGAGYGLFWVSAFLYAARAVIWAVLMNHDTWFVVSAMLSTALLVWLIRALWKGGAFNLTKAYLKAKKDKVCPTVLFVESE